MDLLEKARQFATTPAPTEEQKAKRARQDKRVSAIYAALAPLSGQTIRWQGGFATLDVFSQYNEAVIAFCKWEAFQVRDETRWRKTKHCASKWTFSPVGERGLEVVWEHGVQTYEDEDAAMDDVARKIGPLLCGHPLEA